jgi:Ca2+-binding RTX toxin-like protein
MTATFGPEFLLNTSTFGSQGEASVTALADGRFVATWTDFAGEFDDLFGGVIRAQLFNADGSKAGAELLVSPTGFVLQTQSSVAATADGGFVVSWTDDNRMGEVDAGTAIRAQVFGADGQKAGQPILVNSTTGEDQRESAVTALADGQFIVTWRDESETAGDTDGSAVRAQIFDAEGAKVGNEFLINKTTSKDQSQPAIAMLSDGRFVVSYSDGSAAGADPSSAGVRAQIFNANGTKSGNEFLVNTATKGDQFASALTALTGGGFVATWTDFGSNAGDNAGAAVRAQVFNSAGAKVGAEFLVNTVTANSQSTPVIATLPDGRFVISWNDDSSNLTDIRAQVFNADGSKSGEEFVVNTTTSSLQNESTITVLADGRFVIGWTDFSGLAGGESGSGVMAQVFDPRTAAILTNGSALDDQYVGTAFNDSLAGALGDDQLDGQGGNDVIFGGDGRDILRGGLGHDDLGGDGGADQLIAGSGNDSLNAGDGADLLRGEAGRDVLSGGGGNDSLHGGSGKDSLRGGAGEDDFIFASAVEATGDQILDFQRGVDDINLRAFMKGGEFIGALAFSGEADQVRYVKATGLLQGDVNGDGKVDWSLVIANKAALTAVDFIF